MEGEYTLSWCFSRFPGGSCAAGLLLLRAAIGLTAVAQGSAYFTEQNGPDLWRWLIALVTLLAGGALIVGLLTVVAGALVGLIAIATTVSWLPAPSATLFDALLPTGLVVVVAFAITLTGPGAWSVDARLFGFREIVMPRIPRAPDR